MSEIITIHLGQTGIQLGNQYWKLNCFEHGIQPNGQMLTDSSVQMKGDLSHQFFKETSSGKYVPRTVYADLEPSVIDEVRLGSYRQLFHPDQLLNQDEDAADVYCCGRQKLRSDFFEQFQDCVRRQAEQCSSLQGFLLFRSICGGTGSGFGNRAIQSLFSDYSKKKHFQILHIPSPSISNTVLETYNTVLSIHEMIDFSDISIVFDNEALYDISSNLLDIEKPLFGNINQLVSQAAFSLTSSIRYDTIPCANFHSIATNLIPYNRIQFINLSYAPLAPKEKAARQQISIDKITKDLFEKSNIMHKIDFKHGKYISCFLHYNGDVNLKDIDSTLFAFKENPTFLKSDYVPALFKANLNYQPLTVIPGGDIACTQRTCCMLANNSAMIETFSKVNYNFDLMYAKRAYVHWYVSEGMDEAEFQKARKDLAVLEKDYEEIVCDTAEGGEYDESPRDELVEVKSPGDELVEVKSPGDELVEVVLPLSRLN